MMGTMTTVPEAQEEQKYWFNEQIAKRGRDFLKSPSGSGAEGGLDPSL